MVLDVKKEIVALQRMPVAELRRRHAELFGEQPRSSNRQWLFRRMAWRVQALAEGDLSGRARQRAADLARDADLRTRPPKAQASDQEVGPAPTVATVAQFSADLRLPMPGTMLTRVFKGCEYRVAVLPDGFELDGSKFKSLTAVAYAITGSHWNGYHFFGLRGGNRQ
jgi:hypothetical protein